jgi:hypothetical protein
VYVKCYKHFPPPLNRCIRGCCVIGKTGHVPLPSGSYARGCPLGGRVARSSALFTCYCSMQMMASSLFLCIHCNHMDKKTHIGKYLTAPDLHRTALGRITVHVEQSSIIDDNERLCSLMPFTQSARTVMLCSGPPWAPGAFFYSLQVP